MPRRSRRSIIAEPLTKELKWDVEQIPVIVEGNALSNHRAIVRNDNREVLAVAKNSYHPATNERFLEVIARLHEFTGFHVEGYSVFQGGRKVLAFLKNEQQMKVGDFDSNNYMVVGNSFDCSTGFFTGISNVVVRCTNQFSRMNINQNIRHNSQLSIKINELIQFYKGFMLEQTALQATFSRWNEIPVTQAVVNAFADKVLQISTDDISSMKRNLRVSLLESIGTEMDAMGSTAYGLFNGLTHFTSHVVKSSNKTFGNALGHSAKLNKLGYTFLSQL